MTPQAWSSAWLCQTLCNTMDCSTSGFPVLYLLQFAQTHVHSVGDAILSPLLLLPSIFPGIRIFSTVTSSHQLAKVLGLQLQHQPFQWIFRVDFLQDWLVWSCCPRDSRVLQHHNSKASILQCSVFFRLQLSHLYVTTGKRAVLTIWPLLAKWCFSCLICCLDFS